MILTTMEGMERLRKLEDAAIANFHNSQDAFNSAIVALFQISAERLWEYSRDDDGIMLRDYEGGGSFEAYLARFCKIHGVSRSSVQYHLKTVRTWAALGRPIDQLVEIGIRRASPIQEIVAFDGRTGEIEFTYAEKVIEPGADPIDVTNRKIDEVLVLPQVPLHQADVRKALTIDIDASAADVTFFYTSDGSIGYTYETQGDGGNGVLLSWSDLSGLPGVVREKLEKRLRVIK